MARGIFISIHALLAESDPFFLFLALCHIISIHALLAESDIPLLLGCTTIPISIHALLAESDVKLFYNLTGIHNFYPRSPCGERRVNYLSIALMLYFYPRSPCGERQYRLCQLQYHYFISIHALLAESDVVSTVKFARPVLFLSTLSLRRATRC